MITECELIDIKSCCLAEYDLDSPRCKIAELDGDRSPHPNANMQIGKFGKLEFRSQINAALRLRLYYSLVDVLHYRITKK